MHCVFFFGTHNYAWIMDSDLRPYLEFKETLNRGKKSAAFRKAIEEIEEFLAGKGNFKTSAGTQAAAALAAGGSSRAFFISILSSVCDHQTLTPVDQFLSWYSH